jgi:hypothetical protein
LPTILPKQTVSVLRLPSIAVVLVLMASALSAQASVTPADIDRLAGPGWTGTLTYRDYSSESRTTIKAALLIARIEKPTDAGTGWDFRVAYADEPHANSGDTISLSTDGRRFRNAMVTERRVLADGRVRIVTEEDGRDNDRPARIRTVYLIGERAASLQKWVRYEGAEYFERHIYEWKR